MKKPGFDDLNSPAAHARWRMNGIKKYLPAKMDASTKALWNEFIAWSKRVNTPSEVESFEHDLERRFLANNFLRKAFWKRVFEEDRIFHKIKSQLSELNKSIERLETQLG